ncbi:GNAT family N-acetyltransferase, partial [Amylibacter sp.]|nr:GNAT family N-acetyltransferase [Amylibacter sp.]
MIDEDRVELTVVGKISDIGEFDWDACASSSDAGSRPVDPFVTYRFLKGLEDSKSIGAGTGWVPQYIVAKYNKKIIGVMPSFAKGHSQGEYIFDHNWAHAYENSGGKYYPKLQVSIPFTPVTGRRFLTLPEFHDIAQSALLEGLQIIVSQQKWSSAHITFCSAEEFKAG